MANQVDGDLYLLVTSSRGGGGNLELYVWNYSIRWDVPIQ